MKRFSETDKWKDPWFRKLSAGAKLVFFFLVDNCDNAGVWSADKELAEFSIGMQIQWEKVLESFGDRVEVLRSGDWLLTKFIAFQFGELSEACKPHLQILRLIEKHRVSKGYPKGIHTLKEKEKDKEKDKRKGSAEGKPMPAIPEILSKIDTFEQRWTEFAEHRKEIKKPLTPLAARNILASLCERPTDAAEALATAIRRSWQGFEWSWIDKDLPPSQNGDGMFLTR